MHPDKNLVKEQMSKIKKDGTLSGAIAYKLTDLTTPVKLTAYKGIGGAVVFLTWEDGSERGNRGSILQRGTFEIK